MWGGVRYTAPRGADGELRAARGAPTMSPRSRRLAILLFVALFLRSLAMFTPFNVDRLFGDESEYASYARNLATRGVFEAPWISGLDLKAHRPPIFSGFLALNHLLAGEEGFLRSAKIMNVFIGSCIPLLVFLCIELLIGIDTSRKRRTAFVCGLFCAAYPYLILFGLLIMSEILFTTLALLTSYLLLRVARQPDSSVVLAATGIVAGLATLTRPGFVLFPGIACLFLFLRMGPERTPGKRLALLAIILAAYCATLSPWLARNYRELERFPVLATNGAEPFWIGNHPDSKGYMLSPVTTKAEKRDWEFALNAPDELERDRRYREMALRYIRDDPVRYVLLGLEKAVYLWHVETTEIRFLKPWRRFLPMGDLATKLTTLLLSVPFLLLAPVFFATFFFGRPAAERYLLTSFIAYSTLVSMVFFGSPRFHLPFLPQLIICSSQILLLERSDFADRRKLLYFTLVVVTYLSAVAYFRPV